jgi:hypothetical protein
MSPFEDRHSRQRRLAEVGAVGQERLDRAELVVPEHEGSDVACEYLLRAGVRSVVIERDGAPAPFPFADAFEFAHSRELAHGAWRALRAIRDVLGMQVQTRGSVE